MTKTGITLLPTYTPARLELKKPSLAFLGVGWIGRNRMEAIAKSNVSNIISIADSSDDCLLEAEKSVPGTKLYSTLDELLPDEPDGIVIATPSAMHAQQTIAALKRGIPVFCQKPLGRNYIETLEVVETARKANLLLGLDLSYRYTKAFEKILEIIKSGEIGRVYAVNLVFHNAYGPGKSWFYDINSSGGGCVIDLGIHLIDMALYALDFPEVKAAKSRIYSHGNLISRSDNIVEDYASSIIELENDITIQLNCSWNLSAGKQAIIEASFHGITGGVSLKNINGSYYDFNAELYRGTRTDILCTPPDDWGGRAAIEWAKKLTFTSDFDDEAFQFVQVAYALDCIYGRI